MCWLKAHHSTACPLTLIYQRLSTDCIFRCLLKCSLTNGMSIFICHELQEVMERYRDVGLPGAMGSVDVVHCKWSKWPASDFNHAKGKEGYPTLAFQCISDYNHQINLIFGPRKRNDKHIVKLVPNVKKNRRGWYKDTKWCYYCCDDTGATDVGAYLISNNGYLHWPITTCPFMHVNKATCEEYFSSSLESVHKDVKCVFGILEKR